MNKIKCINCSKEWEEDDTAEGCADYFCSKECMKEYVDNNIKKT